MRATNTQPCGSIPFFLKAPRFVRTESGLVMIGGEAVPGIH
jgi:hypothetical protein